MAYCVECPHCSSTGNEHYIFLIKIHLPLKYTLLDLTLVKVSPSFQPPRHGPDPGAGVPVRAPLPHLSRDVPGRRERPLRAGAGAVGATEGQDQSHR